VSKKKHHKGHAEHVVIREPVFQGMQNLPAKREHEEQKQQQRQCRPQLHR
jgi:hypothetical protein